MLTNQHLGVITANARRFADKTAIICDQRRLSFAELDDRVGRLAKVLHDRGFGTKTIATLTGETGWEWVVAYHAVLRCGAIINPVNALLTADEVDFIVGDCNAGLVIADGSRLRALEDCISKYGLQTLSLDEVERLSASGESLEPLPRDQTELSTICYTSGTSGRPKGAMLNHRSVVMNAAMTAVMHGRGGVDVIVSALPLAHVYGNVVMNSAIMVGATLCLLRSFDEDDVLAAIERHHATCFDGVPTMYYRILATPRLASTDLSSLRMCAVGGQTMPAEKMGEVEGVFGCPLIELWGMSELGGLGTTFPWTGPKTIGSVGFPMPVMEVRTLDLDTGQVTACGEAGELQVRGPLVMDGYLNNDDATRLAIDGDGWLSTGDIAKLDDKGQIFILDRRTDVILTSGNNVYPAELERVIAAHPSVDMVAVARSPHPTKGEVPHAYVVLKPDAGKVDHADAIIEHCRAFLAPYKIPRAVSFVDDLPKNSTGKIMRRALNR